MQAEPAPGPTVADESSWAGVDETIEDPEEERVVFCALDSFRSVSHLYIRTCMDPSHLHLRLYEILRNSPRTTMLSILS